MAWGPRQRIVEICGRLGGTTGSFNKLKSTDEEITRQNSCLTSWSAEALKLEGMDPKSQKNRVTTYVETEIQLPQLQDPRTAAGTDKKNMLPARLELATSRLWALRTNHLYEGSTSTRLEGWLNIGMPICTQNNPGTEWFSLLGVSYRDLCVSFRRTISDFSSIHLLNLTSRNHSDTRMSGPRNHTDHLN